MTVIAIFPALLCLAGAIVYLLVRRAEAKEMGRIAFFVGLFFFAWSLGEHVVRIGGGR